MTAPDSSRAELPETASTTGPGHPDRALFHFEHLRHEDESGARIELQLTWQTSTTLAEGAEPSISANFQAHF